VRPPSSDRALLQLIESRLREGASIEVGGMGSFRLAHDGQVAFRPCGEALVFLGYAEEDRPQIRKLFRQLQQAGFEPWMDCQKLLPGQNWPRAIQQTIEISDFFIGCFSKRSASKRGHFQSELNTALEVASHFPEEDVFFIPVRLEECELPRRIASSIHYVDLFPDWNRGVKKLIAALRRQQAARNARHPS